MSGEKYGWNHAKSLGAFSLADHAGRIAIIDAESIKPRILRLHALLEIIPVAQRFWRPDNFGESAYAREDHVLDVLEVGHVFGPDIGLSAENVPLELRRQFCRHRLEGVDLLQREITANGMWFGGVIARLI